MLVLADESATEAAVLRALSVRSASESAADAGRTTADAAITAAAIAARVRTNFTLFTFFGSLLYISNRRVRRMLSIYKCRQDGKMLQIGDKSLLDRFGGSIIILVFIRFTGFRGRI